MTMSLLPNLDKKLNWDLLLILYVKPNISHNNFFQFWVLFSEEAFLFIVLS